MAALHSETVPRTSVQRSFPSQEVRQLLKWMGQYEVVTPIELLHFVLENWENYGFIDRQCDATEFLQVFHQLSNAPQSIMQVRVFFETIPIKGSENRMAAECSLQEFIDPHLKNAHGTLEIASREVLLPTRPYGVNEGTDEYFWIESRIADWDAEVDLYVCSSHKCPMCVHVAWSETWYVCQFIIICCEYLLMSSKHDIFLVMLLSMPRASVRKLQSKSGHIS